jgi:tetratricopeptide (TPR) repeat protein
MMYKTLFCYLCSMKNAFLIYLCIFLLQQSVLGSNSYRWKPIDASFDSLGKQLELVDYKNNERMQFYPLVTRMYQIANLKNNRDLQARALYWDAWLKFETNTEETETLIEEALEKVDSVNYTYDHARIFFVKGMLLAKHNKYPQAYRTFKRQENYFKSINDLYSLGYTYVNIGSIMRRIGEYQEGYKYYLQADEIFKKGGFIDDKIKNRHNIGISQYHLGHPQKGIEILTALLDERIAQEDLPFRTDVLTSLYFVSQTLPDKEKYAREAYKTAQKITSKTSQTYTLINMGALYIYKNEKDSALFYFQKARHSAEANKDAFSAIHTLYGLAEIYDRKNLPDSAYQYLKQYLQYKEETTGYAKSNEINQYEMKMAIEQYENELHEASERIELHKKLTIASFLIGLMICCIIGYIFWLSRKKEKIAKQLKEAENRELNERLQRQQLQISYGVRSKK